jgi:hypothetical protein
MTVNCFADYGNGRIVKHKGELEDVQRRVIAAIDYTSLTIKLIDQETGKVIAIARHRVMNAEGKSNYLCRHKVQGYYERWRYPDSAYL